MMLSPWNPDQINPALMTSKEYLQFCNQKNEWHPESAYNWTLAQMNTEFTKKSDYKKIRTFKVNGIDFDLMCQTEKLVYAQRNLGANSDTDPYLRLDGKIIYYNDEEIKRLGYQPTGFTFAIFDGETKVAAAQDEWGCMLIAVASEYRSFGLGTIIGKVARTYEPGKTSGGFTGAGSKNFVRVHREFVRDALANGFYSKMVRSGQVTIDRVKEIVASAKVQQRPPKNTIDLSNNSPKDWLLYSDLGGTFVLYDRKLATVIDNSRYDDRFTERMIKGYVYVQPGETVMRIKQFGADSKGIAAFMLSLAYTTAKLEKLPLWVEKEEYDLQGFEYGPEENTVGYRSREVLKGKLCNYRTMVEDEIQFRKSFDEHDEFKHRMHELADSKYQMVPEVKIDRWGRHTY